MYEKNALGDVYRIRDANGTEVAYYEYDAWGNITTKTGTMADINPFRYRGYYYDNETGFYYLQTRYYDPETRLFINADNYEILGTLASTLGQLNLYTYCNNNPIMYTDPTGYFWETVGGWFVTLGEGIDWFFDELRFVVDNIFESFYCNVGVGVGHGVGVEIGIFEFSLVASVSVGIDILPSPSFGVFERMLFSFSIVGLGCGYGMDEYSDIGNGLNEKINSKIQDVTFGIGFSLYVGAGGFFEFGFNFSKFFRLMGW